jgi:hypothetical protein
MTLISARDYRLFHLPALRPFFALSGAHRSRNFAAESNLIECETRGGFHASFGRGNPLHLGVWKVALPRLWPVPDRRDTMLGLTRKVFAVWNELN